jgi:hypothetical protein
VRPETIRLRDEGVTWRLVDDEVVVLDRRTWAYLSINDSGALLWARLVDGATKAELVATLVEGFELAQERADADVESFLDTLREHDLLA